MIPVDVLKTKPVAADRSGLIDHDVIGSPLDTVGILFIMTEFKTYDGAELE
jgi:hypothetical protein